MAPAVALLLVAGKVPRAMQVWRSIVPVTNVARTAPPDQVSLHVGILVAETATSDGTQLSFVPFKGDGPPVRSSEAEARSLFTCRALEFEIVTRICCSWL